MDAQQILSSAASPADPAEALAAVVALRRLADDLELSAVEAAHRDGWSFAEIGEALGVSKQAVHKKHGARVRRR